MKHLSFLVLPMLCLGFLFACTETPPMEYTYTLLPGVGIAELNLGESGQKVIDQFGEPRYKNTVDGTNVIHYMEYFSEGLKFYFAPSTSMDVDLSLPITQISAFGTFGGSTDQGVVLGASLFQVRVLHGDPNFFDEVLNQDQFDGIDFCYDSEDFVFEIKVR